MHHLNARMWPTVHIAEAAETPWDNWGDYGHILVHGMVRHLPRDGENLRLERAGPFAPPISFPGVSDIVLTDSAKQQLEKKVPHLSYRPVLIAKAVRIDWHVWDTSAEAPPFYPASGEPEDYILKRRHSSAVARAIGSMWELVPDIVFDIQSDEGRFNANAYEGQHFIRASDLGGYAYVSPELRAALADIAPDWISFSDIPVHDA